MVEICSPRDDVIHTVGHTIILLQLTLKHNLGDFVALRTPNEKRGAVSNLFGIAIVK